MAIIINTDNFILGNLLDIFIIFGLGLVLLLFANALYTDSRLFMLYLALVVISVIVFNLIYISHNIPQKKKESTWYNVLVFIQLYIIVLFAFLTIMYSYVRSNYYIQ
jgi:high-affinity K+ transport system ATPase subunit B